MSKVLEIKTGIIKGLKSQDTDRVVMLRLILAELENKKVDKKLETVEQLNTNEIEGVLTSQLKKLDQELEGLNKAGRSLEKVEKQKGMILEYLPKQMTEKEIESLVKEKIKELGIEGKKGQGKLMGVLSKDLKGKADLGQVSKIVSGQLK